MRKEKIYIFDTTLRDGQQSPGAGMSFNDNIKYADLADSLNIDILEAGFPAASNMDFDIVNTISKRMSDKSSKMMIAGLCQLREKQVEITMKSLLPSLKSGRSRIHMYLPVSPVLAQASLGGKNNNTKNIENVYYLVKLAADSRFDVEFSAEGYSRLDGEFDYVSDVFRAAVSAGANVINCPDTIGGSCIREGDNYFVKNISRHANIIQDEFPDKNIIWSVHCHNDLGLALENSMNAVFDGVARQIEGCINGVGERAGNASLEQCIMYLERFGKQKDIQYYTDTNLSKIQEISDFVNNKMIPRQLNSPITGGNSAKHTSGGHINAILKDPMSYQPFDPECVGGEISFVFGPLSGGNHAKKIINDYGYICEDDEKASIAQQIKDIYSTRRKGITDEELLLAYKKIRFPININNIKSVKLSEGYHIILEGLFFGSKDIMIKRNIDNSALADVFDLISKKFSGLEIKDYYSESINDKSIDSNAQSTIILKYGDDMFEGVAVDANIDISAVKALINAFNNMYLEDNYRSGK